MNSYNQIAFLFAIVFLLSSCTEDFQLTEPYKDIPVIYGIIDRSDTAQYFRIEKGFVDENIPATEIAQNADSLYYPNPSVILYDITTNKSYPLIRVDGNLEGYPRADGPFAKAPNYLYKLSTKTPFLNGGDSLKIELIRSANSVPVTSRISLVNDISFTRPDATTRQFKIFYGSSIQFQWKNKSNTSVFDMKAMVYIEEYNKIDSSIKKKIIEIPLGNNIQGSIGKADNLSNTIVSGATFYNFFHDQLTPETGVERYIEKIDFYLTGGGPEIGEYYSILNANTGITASQEIPRYSNIYEGANKAFGIFSSVVTIVKTITPEDPTVDSLQVHPLTRDLNFK